MRRPDTGAMKITFDHQIFCGQQYGGISRYFCEIAPRIAACPGTELSITAPCYINSYLREVTGVPVVGAPVPKLPRTAGLLLKVNQALSTLLFQVQRPDIVHETYYSPKRLAPRGARTVITVYDMIFEKFRQSFPESDPTGAMKELAVRHADHVICISENTRLDLMELLGVPSEKISVVHLGCSLPRQAVASAQSPVDGPYLLYVGLRRGYKNGEGLLRAYAASPRLKAGHKLVFFGGGPFLQQEQETIAALGLTSQQVLQLPGDDSKLASMYAHASVFVYPSLYEGFGVPPLEAMTFGCPVASSNTSSMPEVLGNAAHYFDPNNIDEIACAIEAVIDSGELSADLVRRGKERIRIFTWERCAMETVKVYRDLL